MISRPHKEDYTNLGRLGSGGFGKVKKVKRLNDGKILACKSINISKDARDSGEGELEYLVLSRLKHPYVVGYVEYRQEPEKARLYMEYCSGGDGLGLIKETIRNKSAIPERKIWSMIYQLASALMYCHYGVDTVADGRIGPSQRLDEWDPVIHRDIKPANIMICHNDENTIKVKLGDFGLSRIIHNEDAPSTFAGTLHYQPPEIDLNHPSGIKWTKKCDIFSLGCTLYHMCHRKPPVPRLNPPANLQTETPTYMYSERLKKCIASCMCHSPEDRPDAFDLLRQVQRARNDTETQYLVPPAPDEHKNAATAMQRYTRSIRCLYCRRKWSGNTTAEASTKAQKHFEKKHRKSHGTYRCRFATCQYSQGSGLYSSHELLRHYETDHPGRRPPSPEPPIFCSSPDCFWGLGFFEGFATEEAEERHYLAIHQDREISHKLIDQLVSHTPYLCPFPDCFELGDGLFSGNVKVQCETANKLRDHINHIHLKLSKEYSTNILWNLPRLAGSDLSPDPSGTLRHTKSVEDLRDRHSTDIVWFDQRRGLFGNANPGGLSQPSNLAGGPFGNSSGFGATGQPIHGSGILFGGSNEPKPVPSSSHLSFKPDVSGLPFGHPDNYIGGPFGNSGKSITVGQPDNRP